MNSELIENELLKIESSRWVISKAISDNLCPSSPTESESNFPSFVIGLMEIFQPVISLSWATQSARSVSGTNKTHEVEETFFPFLTQQKVISQHDQPNTSARHHQATNEKEIISLIIN